MADSVATELPEPICEGGYTRTQLQDILGPRFAEFARWMRGQTLMLCEGRTYSHATQQYVESCDGVAHGTVVYPWDLRAFLAGRPVFD